MVGLLNQTVAFTDEGAVSSDVIICSDSRSRDSWEWTSPWSPSSIPDHFSSPRVWNFILDPLMCNILSWAVSVPGALPRDAGLEPVSGQGWSRDQGKVRSTDPLSVRRARIGVDTEGWQQRASQPQCPGASWAHQGDGMEGMEHFNWMFRLSQWLEGICDVTKPEAPWHPACTIWPAYFLPPTSLSSTNLLFHPSLSLTTWRADSVFLSALGWIMSPPPNSRPARTLECSLIWK